MASDKTPLLPKDENKSSKRQKVLGGTRKFGTFLYNTSTKEILGLKPSFWVQIILFYAFFYACVGGFTYGYYWLYQNFLIDDAEPRLTKIIGTSPKLTLLPKVLNKSPLQIVINKDISKTDDDGVGNVSKDWQGWQTKIWEDLKPYYNVTKQERGKDCMGADEQADHQRGCKFPMSELGPCGGGSYGYDRGTPCIFLRLNRIYNLQNVPYNMTEDKEKMPQRLKDHVNTQEDPNQVWVDCAGKDAEDNENIERMEYFPQSRGFSNKFFPYLKQNDYLSPIVAVKIHPKMAKANGDEINIHCRVWGENIEYNKRTKNGYVDLQLKVSDENLSGDSETLDA